jgi:hypothetical protein
MDRAAHKWVLAIAAFVALPSTVVATDDPPPETFDDTMAALEKADPGSPETLNDRLEYAQFLIDAVDVDCHQRLDTAQSQLDAVAGTAAVDVVLPNGRARVSDIQYRVKLARASCGAQPAERESDLREALAAAERAVDLYRDVLDYQSMAVMQFNVAATQRLLGENDASVASLGSVVAMDREYGFHDDAEENGKLLALWKGSQTAIPPSDVPVRAVALKFAWTANDATLGIEIDHASVVDGKVVNGRAYRLFKQHVHAARDGWVVSYEPGQIAYDVAAWPLEPGEARDLAYSFGRALPLPGFEINAKGDFKHVINLGGVATDQSAAVRDLILGHTTQPEAGTSRLSASVVAATKVGFGRTAVEQNAAEDYDFQTGVWIGATLEQGVWYNMSVPLTLPGARQLLVPHDVEFAYTRNVPCTSTSTSPACAEIVVHATPQAAFLAALVQFVDRELGGHPKMPTHFWATTYMRIVTDPNTLTTYLYDARRYWHATGGLGEENPNKPYNHSERLVSTFTYP